MPPIKKRNYRKPRTKVVRKAKRANENNLDLHRMNIKMSGSITPVQGLSVSNYIYSYWSPSPQFNTPPQSMPLFGSTEFNLYRNLYDQFRVTSVVLKIIPRATQTDSTLLVVNNDASTITQGKAVYYSVEDRDGMGPAAAGSLKKYASVKCHKLVSTMKRVYSIKYPTGTWLDCQDPAGLNDLQRQLGMKGGITIYGESLPEVVGALANSVWADVEVEYNVVFCGKAMVSLTTNQDGSTTVSQTPVGTLEAPVTINAHEDNPHSGAIDPSGNYIE